MKGAGGEEISKETGGEETEENKDFRNCSPWNPPDFSSVVISAVLNMIVAETV